MIDLHTHTTASDGTYSPEALINYALEKKLKAVAITDHDTIKGVIAGHHYISSQGIPPTTLELISGIEFSTTVPSYPFDIHIVGLFIQHDHPDFVNGLEHIYHDRQIRNREILTLLQQNNYAITQEQLNTYYKGSVITRSHIADFLVQQGYFSTTKDVFHQLIGNHCPCYVPRKDVSAEKAIQLIKKSGGKAVLAHPTLYPIQSNTLYALVDQLKSYGLSAIETYYTLYSPQETQAMLHIAKRFNLLPSGGSDFHGANKPKNDLGHGQGHLHVPNHILDALRP